MSWEAWGTPPDSEPELCPICDNTQHTPDKCEVAASEAHSRAHYENVIALILQQRERERTHAYAEGRKDEAAEWERVGYIGLDAVQRLAAANLGTTTTITKEAPFDDDVALWRKKA